MIASLFQGAMDMKSRFVRFSFIVTLAGISLSVALLATAVAAQSVAKLTRVLNGTLTPGAQLSSSAGVLALTNVTVIDGNGGPAKPGMTLVISGERIVDMFPTGRKQLPAGTTLMNMDGHYLIPGLIDSHYHFHIGMRDKETEEALRRFAFLGGVTTVRDMAGDAIALAELSKVAADPSVQSPRVYFSALMAGPGHLEGDRRVDQISHGRSRGEAPWARSITPQTDIVRAVSEAKATGATGIKIYTDIAPEIVTKITAEAHRQGLKVWSHAAVYPGRPSDAVGAGVDVLSHSNLIVSEGMNKVPQQYDGSYILLDYNSTAVESKPISDLLQLMVKKGTFLDPTMVVTSRLEKSEKGKIFQDPIRMADWSYMFTMRAHIRRIPIVAGTDVQETPKTQDFPNIHAELELLVAKAGLTPLEAITAATRNGAQVLGISDSYGTIAPGKVADLVVLSADPSVDIRNTTKIVHVIKGGKVHTRENEKEKEEIRQLIRQWDEALVNRNVEFIESILAEDFTYIYSSGQVQNRIELLASIKTPDLKIESSSSTNVRVRIYGNVAVAIAEGRTKGTYKSKGFENHYRFTDVWSKKKEGWKAVATQVTDISR